MKLTATIALVTLALSVAATADASPREDETHFVPNRPLLYGGLATFVAGYAPPVIAATPATVGFVGGLFLHVVTAGLSYFLGCIYPDRNDDPENHDPHKNDAHPESHGYLCLAANGGVQLLVPVAGPLLFVKNHPLDAMLNPQGAPLASATVNALRASAVSQGIGLGLVGLSLAFGHREPVLRKRGATPFVVPTAAGAPGVSVGLAGW